MRRFYAAVNTALQSGQSEDLASIVAADFAEPMLRAGKGKAPRSVLMPVGHRASTTVGLAHDGGPVAVARAG